MEPIEIPEGIATWRDYFDDRKVGGGLYGPFNGSEESTEDSLAFATENW